MRIAYHLGAHCTDDERLLRTLTANRETLEQAGIVVAEAAAYRNLIRDTATQLRGKPAGADTQALVLNKILGDTRAERVILSWDNFMAFPQWVLRSGQLYPAGGERMRAVTRIFPGIEAEFFLAIRNPASFLPELCRRLRAKDPAQVLEGIEPMSLRWSALAKALLDASPDARLTVWCDEDTPLIWPEVLAAVAGIESADALHGADGLLLDLLTPEGIEAMKESLGDHPPASIEDRRAMVASLLERHARPEKITAAFEMPGWDEDLVAQMTAQYEGDCAYLAGMPGVTFLAP